MDDFDLYESLKTAAPKLVGRLYDWVKTNPHIVGGAAGAAIASAGSYLAYKPNKETGKSVEQTALNSQTEREPSGEGYARGVAEVVSRAAKGLANVSAKHPVKAALSWAPTGAGIGMSVARTLTRKK